MEVILQDKLVDEIKANAAIRDRKVYINEEVDRNSMFKATYFLDRLVSLDNKSNIPMSERESIEILIDSYGGYIYHGLSLISKIEELKDMGYKIVTTVQSVAMSMGFMISIVGSERRAYRHARIMCHQPSSGTWGTLEDMERDVDETKALWDKMKQIITKYTFITNEKLDANKKCNFDWFMWPEEAQKLHVIDSIL